MGQKPSYLFSSFGVYNGVHLVDGRECGIELRVHHWRCVEDHVHPTVESELIQAVVHQEGFLSEFQNLLDLFLTENCD